MWAAELTWAFCWVKGSVWLSLRELGAGTSWIFLNVGEHVPWLRCRNRSWSSPADASFITFTFAFHSLPESESKCKDLAANFFQNEFRSWTQMVSGGSLHLQTERRSEFSLFLSPSSFFSSFYVGVCLWIYRDTSWYLHDDEMMKMTNERGSCKHLGSVSRLSRANVCA